MRFACSDALAYNAPQSSKAPMTLPSRRSTSAQSFICNCMRWSMAAMASASDAVKASLLRASQDKTVIRNMYTTTGKTKIGTTPTGDPIYENNVEILKRELAAGRWAVIFLDYGTNDGHYAVVKSYSGGKYYYYDPYSNGGNYQFTSADFTGYGHGTNVVSNANVTHFGICKPN